MGRILLKCTRGKRKGWILLFLLAGPSLWAQKVPVQYFESHEPAKQEVPFSDAVRVGPFYFLSGQIGIDHSTRTLVAGGIEAETTQAINNIAEVLRHHGLSLSDVVKCTVILANMEDFSTFNTIYEAHFPQKPARTTFAAIGLARNAQIEIEVVAVKQ